MKEEIVLRCEDSFEGIFTAIYDAFVYKNKMEKTYEDDITIAIGTGGNYSLFVKEIEVKTDLDKSQKTIKTIQNRLGHAVYNTLFRALCHYDEDRATIVLGYLVRGFQTGQRIREHLADEYVMRVMELSRKVSNEEQRMKGFLRFRDVGQFLFAEVEPKCNLIPIFIEHFEDRYPNENFVIYDHKRKLSAVHPAFSEAFFVTGEDLHKEFASCQDEYEALWIQYFNTMGIKERKNEKCQMNMMPKWYRKNMIEQHQII